MHLTGEGLIYEVTASGGCEDCIGMLADELADLVDEPFVRLVIRMKRGRRRQRISRRAYLPHIRARFNLFRSTLPSAAFRASARMA